MSHSGFFRCRSRFVGVCRFIESLVRQDVRGVPHGSLLLVLTGTTQQKGPGKHRLSMLPAHNRHSYHNRDLA